MNTEELRRALTELEVIDHYSIREQAEERGLPDRVTVVEPESDGAGWAVYYAERGVVTGRRHFDTEDEACQYVWNRATKPLPPPVEISAEELERGKRLSAEKAAERRARRASRDVDPATGRLTDGSQ